MDITGILRLEGYEVTNIAVNDAKVSISVRVKQATGKNCPLCGTCSSSVHSRYIRKVKDLPISGQAVVLQVQLRRYYCRQVACSRQTFTEGARLLADARVQQSQRFRKSTTTIGMLVGGEAGARLAQHLAMPLSADTILRLVKSAPLPEDTSATIIGIDDWAWRKRVNYGTILVDLERKRPLDLLPDRTAATVATWLAAHPGIQIITRDRSTEYRRGIDLGAPDAHQVADRWHLLHNLREALERAGLRLKATVERVLSEAGFAHQLVPRDGQEALERQLKRQTRLALYEAIQRRYREGATILGLAREFQMSRGGIRGFVYADRFPEQSPRRLPSQLDPYRPRMQQLWDEGCHVAKQIWRTLCAEGYNGSVRQVHKWVQRRRVKVAPTTPKKFRDAVAHRIATRQPERLPTPSTLAWLWVQAPERLDPEAQAVLALLQQDETLKHLYDLSQRFVYLLHKRLADDLPAWLQSATQSPFPDLKSFALGLQSDIAAVTAACTLPYSNGPVEGHVNRLKMLKRQMYGRAGFALLRARLLFIA